MISKELGQGILRVEDFNKGAMNTMDITGTKVEVTCTMNVSDEHWDNIWKTKEPSVAEESKEVNNEHQ